MSKENGTDKFFIKLLKWRNSASDNTNNNDTISNTKTSPTFYPCGLINDTDTEEFCDYDSDLLNKTIQHNKDVLASNNKLAVLTPFERIITDEGLSFCHCDGSIDNCEVIEKIRESRVDHITCNEVSDTECLIDCHNCRACLGKTKNCHGQIKMEAVDQHLLNQSYRFNLDAFVYNLTGDNPTKPVNSKSESDIECEKFNNQLSQAWELKKKLWRKEQMEKGDNFDVSLELAKIESIYKIDYSNLTITEREEDDFFQTYNLLSKKSSNNALKLNLILSKDSERLQHIERAGIEDGAAMARSAMTTPTSTTTTTEPNLNVLRRNRIYAAGLQEAKVLDELITQPRDLTPEEIVFAEEVARRLFGTSMEDLVSFIEVILKDNSWLKQLQTIHVYNFKSGNFIIQFNFSESLLHAINTNLPSEVNFDKKFFVQGYKSHLFNRLDVFSTLWDWESIRIFNL